MAALAPMRSLAQSSGALASSSKAVAPRVPCSRRASVRVQAAAKLPQGVTNPPKQPDVPVAKNGFVDNAERMNSRAAMIGFFALLALEWAANRGILDMLGLNIGNGLPFEL